jgi:hypothetical protein
MSSPRPRASLLAALIASAFALPAAHASISLIATGSLSGSLSDLSGLGGNLENGQSASLLGGIGSGLAWAGGNTFLALPDRGPNAVAWAGNAGTFVDNTTTYIPRVQTLSLTLTASNGALRFTLGATLNKTTLLYSTDALVYGAATPSQNSAGKSYFSGRSDNFDPSKSSLNPLNARLDPEALRVSADGKSFFVADEYGPYVYQFDRATGARIRSFALPANYGITTLSSVGATEISANSSSGRVANKGMEGLAITPDGKSLVGFMQSPLAQEGGDGGRYNRLIKIDIATGNTVQYAYDNQIGSKTYNSSEIVALNDHQFLVLERDGKGLGDGSNSDAVIKRLYLIDTAGAQDVSNVSGVAALAARAVTKTLFLDIKSLLNAAGIADNRIPAKLEGLAFGQDVVVDGVLTHTLFVANDNDFLSSNNGVDNPNRWFVFGVTDADLARLNASYAPQQIAAAIPEPQTYALMLGGLALVGSVARRRRRA